MKRFIKRLKLCIPKWAVKFLLWLSAVVAGALASQIISERVFNPRTFAMAAFVVVASAVYFWLKEKPDQRDMKTVVADGRVAFGLTDDMLARTSIIDVMPQSRSLEHLLNGGKLAVSRVMGKQDRIDLPVESAILQVAFLPVDRNGRTIVWKRRGKWHVFNKSHSVLIPCSPYCSFFGQEFREKGDEADRRLLTLRSIYNRKVGLREADCRPSFHPLRVLWRPAQKGERAAYCFYLFAARYDLDFDCKEDVFKAFGRKHTAKYSLASRQYLEKDHDAFRISVNPSSDEDKHLLKSIDFEKVDRYVLEKYDEYSPKCGDDATAHPRNGGSPEHSTV